MSKRRFSVPNAAEGAANSKRRFSLSLISGPNGMAQIEQLEGKEALRRVNSAPINVRRVNVAAVQRSKTFPQLSAQHVRGSEEEDEEYTDLEPPKLIYPFGEEPIDEDESPAGMSPYVLHPHQRARLAWDSVAIVLLFYNLIEIPYRVCFDAEPDPWSAADVINLLVDILFLVDVAINFRTAYYDEGELVHEPKRICRNYTSGWFWIDFCTSIPLNKLVETFGEGNGAASSLSRLPRLVRIVRVVRLLKLLRLLKFLRVVKKWEDDSNQSFNRVLRLGKLVFLMTFIAHMAGCIWYLIAASQPEDTETWVTFYRDKGVQAQASFYILSIYWAFQTLTTVGYGDVLPRSDAERIWAAGIFFIGACIFAYLVGNISSLISKEDRTATILRKKMGSINSYMRYRKLPKDLQGRIRAHYEYCWRRTTIYNERHILRELPSFLMTEVVLFLNRDVLVCVPFFADLDDNVLAALVIHLKPIQCAPEQFVFRQNSAGREMYILMKGKIQVIVDNRVFCNLSDGSFFGEFALIPDAPTTRMASTKAKTYCDLFSLSRSDFETILKNEYPEIYAQILARAEQFFAAEMDPLSNTMQFSSLDSQLHHMMQLRLQLEASGVSLASEATYAAVPTGGTDTAVAGTTGDTSDKPAGGGGRGITRALTMAAISIPRKLSGDTDGAAADSTAPLSRKKTLAAANILAAAVASATAGGQLSPGKGPSPTPSSKSRVERSKTSVTRKTLDPGALRGVSIDMAAAAEPSASPTSTSGAGALFSTVVPGSPRNPSKTARVAPAPASTSTTASMSASASTGTETETTPSESAAPPPATDTAGGALTEEKEKAPGFFSRIFSLGTRSRSSSSPPAVQASDSSTTTAVAAAAATGAHLSVTVEHRPPSPRQPSPASTRPAAATATAGAATATGVHSFSAASTGTFPWSGNAASSFAMKSAAPFTGVHPGARKQQNYQFDLLSSQINQAERRLNDRLDKIENLLQRAVHGGVGSFGSLRMGSVPASVPSTGAGSAGSGTLPLPAQAAGGNIGAEVRNSINSMFSQLVKGVTGKRTTTLPTGRETELATLSSSSSSTQPAPASGTPTLSSAASGAAGSVPPPLDAGQLATAALSGPSASGDMSQPRTGVQRDRPSMLRRTKTMALG